MLKSDRRGILIFLAVLLLAAAAALFAAPAPALADSGDPLVDKYIPFDVRTTLIKGIPLYGKGKLHLYMDYSTFREMMLTCAR